MGVDADVVHDNVVDVIKVIVAVVHVLVSIVVVVAVVVVVVAGVVAVLSVKEFPCCNCEGAIRGAKIQFFLLFHFFQGYVHAIEW